MSFNLASLDLHDFMYFFKLFCLVCLLMYMW